MSHKQSDASFLFLSRNPSTCAEKHQVEDLCPKLKEYAGLLGTAFHRLRPMLAESLGLSYLSQMSPTQKEIVAWLIKSSAHYKFLLEVALKMCELSAVSNRSSSWHSSQHEVRTLEKNVPELRYFDNHYFEDPPQHIPLVFHTTDAVEAYKKWYDSPVKKKTKKLSEASRKRMRDRFDCDGDEFRNKKQCKTRRALKKSEDLWSDFLVDDNNASALFDVVIHSPQGTRKMLPACK